MTTQTQSPSRPSFSDSISALSSRLSRAMSRDRTSKYTEHDEERDQVSTMTDQASRSRSRGRELYSSGRGGAGNIHRSVSRDATNDDAPYIERGREPVLATDSAKITHVGRGGAGNVRSPSRDAGRTSDVGVTEHERDVLNRARETQHAVSTGRGGAGNILNQSRSRSREPSGQEERSVSRGRAVHSSGRGGAGNITSLGIESELERVEEVERLEHAHPAGVHSTGRGGSANITPLHAPGVESNHPPTSAAHHQAHLHNGQEYYSSGRGGAGNIRSRSQSREPGTEAQNLEKHGHGHGLVQSALEKVLGHDGT